ncbi:hypothetical protein LTR62_007575 [Meristemomyces frigidus]|uniref:RING-CH-type domain-containing protein n=1 Tax=Meristemomyces frigidus TaxID=1508187 RepID=A0AAN7TBZ0_9PEZI|nr:hypothetical protein LTR62_007575 [Meristemomyces frigidus]
MASLPQRRPSQRRPSPEEESRASPQRNLDTSPEAQSTTPQHPQTLPINHQTPVSTGEERTDDVKTPAPSPTAPSDEVQTCWICFSDSTEDIPGQTSPWRDPCPCALVAHEACLLDWIADIEAPAKNSRARTLRAPKIQCPQCKTEIKLTRSRDYLVDAVRALERLGARSLTPAALLFVGGSLYQSSLLWGVHSIYAVFGVEDGWRILQPLFHNVLRAPLEVYAASPRDAADKLLGLVVDHLVHWRLYVGVPLITPMLILSRTHLADSILPVLPVLFFATQAHPRAEPLDFTRWPPSASLCFAVLPYIRQAYNVGYEKVWGEHIRRWAREVQPRSTQTATEEADENGVEGGMLAEAIDPDTDDDNIFEVRIDGDLWEEWGDNEEADEEVMEPLQPVIQPQQQEQAPPLHQPPLAETEADHAQPPPNIPDNRPPAAARPAPAAAQPHNHEHRLAISTTALAETILGALLFPTLASLSGSLLTFLLPKTWVTSLPVHIPSANWLKSLKGTDTTRVTGLLQTKWGRSLVGGCVFVVVKDAVGVYVRWRLAGMQRGRRVRDWNGVGGVGVRPSGGDS